MNAAGCGCIPYIPPGPDWTHPAFDPASCSGAPMSHADAQARWSRGEAVLGSYQLVFRHRACPPGEACGPWAEVPITDIAWRDRASGVARLVQSSGGVMGLDLRQAICEHYAIGNTTTYNVGAECSGVGATLTCSGYAYPYQCSSSGGSSYRFLGENIELSGTLTDSCLRLQADVESDTDEMEGQIAVLVTF
jgi:hypothetical protein